MVFELLEKMGDVIKSSPTVERLEDEDFDKSFYSCFSNSEEKEDVQKKLMKVSEVTEIIVNRNFNEKLKTRQKDKFQNNEQNQLIQGNEKRICRKILLMKEEQGKVSTSKGNSSIGNKTIRVNIERLDILMNLFEELIIDRGRLESISKEIT